MEYKRFVAFALLAGISLALISAVVIEPYDAMFADGVYTLAGLMLMGFGVWGAILLLR